jgi:predicted transcriptional regulator
MTTKLQKKKDIVMHSQDTYRCKAPTYEVLESMRELTDTGFKLLMYYYSKSTGWRFDDADIAMTLGVTPRTVSNARKELIDKEYLLIEKGKNIDTYFVGKRAVREWKYPADEGEVLCSD